MPKTALTSPSQLYEYFASGCKPRDAWRIGTEHEKVGYCVDTLRPIPYDGRRSIRRVLELLASEDWRPVFEDANPIALKHGLASITLEPGGQLELSGAPLESIHETCKEVAEHLHSLQHITEKIGIGFLGLGFQPKWHRKDIPWMPKRRYAVMRNYMPKVGAYGLDMMLRTATVQANLDFSSEADMSRKMRIGCCLQPLVTALFAASPFVDGRPSGFASYRAHCWLDTDPARTGIPKMIFEDGFGFEQYTDWALDAPMYFVIRNGLYLDCAGQSFRDFMAGRLPALPGERPTMEDWETHLSTVFPEVRLKQYLETRGADAGPRPWICSLPALWKGLLYDKAAIDRCWNWVAGWQHKEVCALRSAVPEMALQTPFRDTTVLAMCETMLDISRAGLERQHVLNDQGQDETIFLEPLRQAIASGKTQADLWLTAFHGRWQGNIDLIFEETSHS